MVCFATIMTTAFCPADFAARAFTWLYRVAAGHEDYGIRLSSPLITIGGSFLPHVRNAQLKAFIESKAEWLLLCDCDMTWPTDSVTRLLSHREPLISGRCHVGRSPYPLAAARLVDGTLTQFKPQALPDDGLLPVDAVGAGFLMIHRNVAEAAGPEAFWPQAGCGEDYSFCLRVRKNGFRPVVDLGCHIGHLKMVSIAPDIISYEETEA